jgi:hypothetical protein
MQHRRATGWLVVVGAAYTVTMLVVVVPRSALSWDETVYASQVNPRTPASFFSAPRARGITYLIAPVVFVTDSTPALRAYLAVLAGVLLVAGYWPWLRVVGRPGLVPLAALLFAGLWVTLFYGAAAMPNAWVAFGAVAATGWFLRYGQERRVGVPAGFAVALGFVALIRPSDAFWVVLPLVVVMGVARRWRRPGPWLACGIGLTGGIASWLVESYLRFGGPLARLHRAGEIQGGLGWHPETLWSQARSINGPSLCRPCHAELADLAQFPLNVYLVWWLAIPPLAVAGLVVAHREGRLVATAVPALTGASVGLSYLLLLAYAAPRFLVPAYALLALPVAGALQRIPHTVPAHARPWTVAALSTCVALHVASQLFVLGHKFDGVSGGVRNQQMAAELARMGVTPPCAVTGTDSIPIAYHAHCAAVSAQGHNQNTTRAGLVALSHRMRMAYITQRDTPPRYLDDWHRHLLAVTPSPARPWYVYTPPRQ